MKQDILLFIEVVYQPGFCIEIYNYIMLSVKTEAILYTVTRVKLMISNNSLKLHMNGG